MSYTLIKKIILGLTIPLSVGCKNINYYQLHQISSTDVNNEQMIYSNEVMDIEYNFWTEYGSSECLISNKTDSLIFLNMELSHLIYNGLAVPYYSNKVTTTTSSSFNTHTTYSYYYPHYNSSSGSVSGNSSMITESKMIVIPPRSSKYISGFSIGYFFKNCDFDLKKDSMVKSFDINNSPIQFSNLFYYSLGSPKGQMQKIKNTFYVSRIAIYSGSKFITRKQKSACGQAIKGSYENVFNYELYNRFYVKYREDK